MICACGHEHLEGIDSCPECECTQLVEPLELDPSEADGFIAVGLDIAAGLLSIADALTRIATIQEKRFEREYPEKEITPATIGHAKFHTAESRRNEEEAALQESDSDWIGPREKAFNARPTGQENRGSKASRGKG